MRLPDDVCKVDARAIAKELDAGIQSSVDLRPCLNSVLASDPRYETYSAAMSKASAERDRGAWLDAYGAFYREVLGPEQTKFWKSVNENLSPNGLCRLKLNSSAEFPGIAANVEIVCEADDKTPVS